ncbi:DNA alkylation repair protein [Gemmobacter nectariphilus]|uniref:DNA alkylation repair protein n=1 Tax=Gemmobacter nectariphilus TaxID=220343 RepID=UPI000427AE09|nr:DNA alkylation repair protein [Gemmobacter nectariphilus]
MTPDDALAALMALADPVKADEMAAYHKIPRRYLGIAVPQIDALARDWRQTLTLDDRLSLAAALWDMGIHETMVAAAKLLEQARIRPDDSGAWALIARWAPGFEGWSTADHASIAGQKRLVADPSRLETVAGWTTHPNMWTRRAALVMTLPWAKMNNPKPHDLDIRERVLGWAENYADDRDWFIQKAIAWWLRDLSRHDADRTRAFLADHGARLKPFARKEAARHL